MQAPRGGRAGLLSYNAFLSLDKSWSAAIGGGARRSAVVCFALQHVWSVDRELSQERPLTAREDIARAASG